MYIEVITPDKKLFAGEANSAIFPGSDGSFQVLKDHAPLISSLGEGKISIKTDSMEEELTISGGLVEVLNNKVVVLAEGAPEKKAD